MSKITEFVVLRSQNQTQKLLNTPVVDARHFGHPKDRRIAITCALMGANWIVVAWTEKIDDWSLKRFIQPVSCKRLPANGPAPIGCQLVSDSDYRYSLYEQDFELILDDGSTLPFEHPWFRQAPKWQSAENIQAQLNDEMRVGERWKRFAGYLFSADNFPDPPPEITPILAFRYGLTNHSRYFRVNKDGSVRLSERKEGRINLMVNGVRWQPRVEVLLARMFCNEPGGFWIEPTQSQQAELATQSQIDRAARWGFA